MFRFIIFISHKSYFIFTTYLEIFTSDYTLQSNLVFPQVYHYAKTSNCPRTAITFSIFRVLKMWLTLQKLVYIGLIMLDDAYNKTTIFIIKTNNVCKQTIGREQHNTVHVLISDSYIHNIITSSETVEPIIPLSSPIRWHLLTADRLSSLLIVSSFV